MNLSKAGGSLGIIVALIVFSIIILFHEFGHFLLAKKNGVGVTEFALGMGPILFSFKRGETVYAVKALPLGGSCAMVGEDTDETEKIPSIPKTYGSDFLSLWPDRYLTLFWPLFLH